MPLSNWKAEFLALREREPPDTWDSDFLETPVSSQSKLSKPWKGAAGFIPKMAIMTMPTAKPKKVSISHSTFT